MSLIYYWPNYTPAVADSAVAATSDIPSLPAAVDHNRSAAAAGPDDSAAPAAAAAAAAVDTGATDSSDASAAASAAAVATDAPSTSAPASAAVVESDLAWLGQFDITDFTSVVLQFTF